MYSKLYDYIIKHKFWVIIIFVVITGLGVYNATRVPIDAVPDITNIQVQVNTKTGSLDPEQIEKTVTRPVENGLTGLPGVTDTRSISRFGLSQVVLVFKDGTDIYKARQMISERLQSIGEELPQGLTPELGAITIGLGEVLMYVVLPKKGSPLETKSQKEQLLYLRSIQDYVVKPFIKSRVSGVSDVDTMGGYSKEIHININLEKLEKYGLSINQVYESLDSIGNNSGGGYIEKGRQQLIVRSSSQVTLSELRNFPVKINVFGRTVRLSELAEVAEGYPQRIGSATYKGHEVVLGTVLMLIGENSRKVSLDAEKALNEIELPDDVEVKVVYSRSYLVDATLTTVGKNLAEGALLVVIVLFLLIGNFRAALIVSLAIPISMLIAVTGMKNFNISTSLMSLGAIDFGLLVDASIIIIENILHRLRAEKDIKEQEKFAIIKKAVIEVVKPVSVGILIISFVYVPILGLDGIEGKMFSPMAATVLMALIASLITAVVLMPVLAFIFFSRKNYASEKSSFLFSILSRSYEKVWDILFRFKPLVFAVLIATIGISLIMLSKLKSEFIPPLDEGDLVVNIVHPSDINISNILSNQLIIENVIQKFPAVKHSFSRFGTAESATDPMGINLVDTFVILEKDRSKWQKGPYAVKTKDDLFNAIKEDIEKQIQDIEVIQSQPIDMRFKEIMEGSRADISLRIYGRDINQLFSLQNEAKEILEKIPGASEVELDGLTSLQKTPVIDIKPDFNKLAYYNILPETVNNIIESCLAGKEIGSYFEYDWKFPIVFRVSDDNRRNIEAISKIHVPLPEGGSVPLSTVCTIDEKEMVTSIARSGGRRYTSIAINLSGRDIVTYVNTAKKQIDSNIKDKDGVSFYWGGQFRNLEKASLRLMIIVPIILLVIFLMIFQLLNSFKQTFLIFLGIPFAVTGGIISLYIVDIPFSISAGVGFIALSGISVLNGLVLMNAVQDNIDAGKPLNDAIKLGAFDRLRSVLMTALVAALGFLPMALNHGIGSEVQKPLATVVIGGIISSTILTIIALPLLIHSVQKRNFRLMLSTWGKNLSLRFKK